jgi:5-deoxy-D-glucuronate isomerase
MTTLPEGYRAVVICRRCGARYYIPKMAKPFKFWFCHRREDGRTCWTFNMRDEP